MPILNYTTQIASDKTIAEIQRALARSGARSILSEFDDQGDIVSVSFQIMVDGELLGFRLPAEWEPILTILKNDPQVTPKLRTPEQARRVAWRIIKDWIEAQLAIIETKMVKPEQAFLPYMLTNTGQTIYETFVNNPHNLLGDGK
jgi:hypothetical protein